MSTKTADLSVTDEALKSASQPEAALDRLKREKLRSHILEGERTLIVYLPPGYEQEQDARYPVLYLQDGQNLFDGSTSYVPGMTWHVAETADALIESQRIEPLIIVGIYHAGEQRIIEYTPVRDRKRGGGGAQRYARLLVDEIKPFIDGEYRTLRDPAHTGVGGSSLGGLVSLFLGMSHPEIFGKVAAMSPSVWWKDRWILRFVRSVSPKPRLKIWLDTGTGEGEAAVADAKGLFALLEDKGWAQGNDLHFHLAEGAIHSESAWAERVGPMLEFLFPLERI
jgi:predicted alpha/beta superfamily hydrolase